MYTLSLHDALPISRENDGMAGDPENRNERGEEQQLVGDRVEQDAELAGRAVAARQVAIEQIGECGDEEHDEGDDLGPVAGNERKQRDDGRERDARQCDDVRQGPPHRAGFQLSVLRTSLLTAFRVSNTPSPRTATASW